MSKGRDEPEFLWDAVIIGGGPAGLAAGMYLARAGWRALLLEKGALGGRARWIERLENYPGFPSGVAGATLMSRFAVQARRWALKSVRARSTGIIHRPEYFRVSTDRAAYRSRAVISCTGTTFRELGLPGEGRLLGRGIYHCAFDRARSFAGRRVAVAGGGDTAVHQALLLARHARKVYIICRGGRLTAIPLLRQKLARCRNIEPICRAVVKRAYKGRGTPKDSLSGVETADTETGQRRRLPVDALFVLIGQEPAPSLGRWRTPPAGFFLAGDGRPGSFRQVAVAAGDGIRAAMECERHLACAS